MIRSTVVRIRVSKSQCCEIKNNESSSSLRNNIMSVLFETTCWLKRYKTVVIIRNRRHWAARQNVSISKYKEMRNIVRSTLGVFKYRFTMKHSQRYESIALLLCLELHSLFAYKREDGCFEVDLFGCFIKCCLVLSFLLFGSNKV